jgi:hypothetical protein
VEAIWVTLEIRLILAELATLLRDRVIEQTPTLTSYARLALKSLVVFILESSVRDARKALSTAQGNESIRQVALSRVKVIRAQFELYQFEIKERYNQEDRATLQTEVTGTLSSFKQELFAAAENTLNEPVWFGRDLVPARQKLVEQMARFQSMVDSGAFSRVCSLAEKRSIIEALKLGSGHFYRYIHVSFLHGPRN